MEDWLVSDKTCKGCKYYGNLASGYRNSCRCCDYTFATGRFRENKPAECEVKVLSDVKAGTELHRRTIRMHNPRKVNMRG